MFSWKRSWPLQHSILNIVRDVKYIYHLEFLVLTIRVRVNLCRDKAGRCAKGYRETGLGEDDIADRPEIGARGARAFAETTRQCVRCHRVYDFGDGTGAHEPVNRDPEKGSVRPSTCHSAIFSAIRPQNREKWHFTGDELLEINPEAKFGSQGDDAARSISFRQVGNTSQSAIQMLHEHYPPGADTGSERYSHEAEEAGIIIEGEIEITVGDETRTLKKGDAYLFNSRLAHRFRNSSDRDCVIVSACTPPTF